MKPHPIFSVSFFNLGRLAALFSESKPPKSRLATGLLGTRITTKNKVKYKFPLRQNIVEDTYGVSDSFWRAWSPCLHPLVHAGCIRE